MLLAYLCKSEPAAEGSVSAIAIGKQRVHGVADTMPEIVADGAQTVQPHD
jgi:hypothetical protein